MPRVTSEKTGETPKRVTRRAGTRGTSGDTTTTSRRARTTAVAKRSAQIVTSSPDLAVSNSPRRKAPTVAPTVSCSSWKTRRVPIGIGVVALLILGISAGIGFTDSGVIDVESAITAQEERARAQAAAVARAAGDEAGATNAEIVNEKPPLASPHALRPRGVGSPTALPPGSSAAGVVNATTTVEVNGTDADILADVVGNETEISPEVETTSEVVESDEIVNDISSESTTETIQSTE